jgi:hypothetical protein
MLQQFHIGLIRTCIRWFIYFMFNASGTMSCTVLIWWCLQGSIQRHCWSLILNMQDTSALNTNQGSDDIVEVLKVEVWSNNSLLRTLWLNRNLWFKSYNTSSNSLLTNNSHVWAFIWLSWTAYRSYAHQRFGLQVQDTISNHQTSAQELLEFQASPDQFTCNTISVSCNQALKLRSVVLDLHSEHLPWDII